MTGYALSDDGLWRSHSWVVTDEVLYETTVARELYFGIELEEEEALWFWLQEGTQEDYYSEKRRIPAAVIKVLRKYPWPLPLPG